MNSDCMICAERKHDAMTRLGPVFSLRLAGDVPASLCALHSLDFEEFIRGREDFLEFQDAHDSAAAHFASVRAGKITPEEACEAQARYRACEYQMSCVTRQWLQDQMDKARAGESLAETK